MKTYRFLGTASDIGGYPALRKFGQAIQLPDDIAAEAVRGNVPLLPDSQFAGFGFTEDELTAYDNVFKQRSATKTFQGKHKAALVKLQEYRDDMAKKHAKALEAAGPQIENPRFDAGFEPEPEPEAAVAAPEKGAKGNK